MTDPTIGLRLTGLLLGCWGVLTAIQGLIGRSAWRDGGPLGWDLQRLQRARWSKLPGLAALWSARGIAGLLGLQLASSGTLLLTDAPAAFFTFYLATLLLGLRFGSDGADKMALVVASGGLLQALGQTLGSSWLFLAGVLWTGGQLTIAYFASGASKLLLAPWRSGAALRAALGSYAYGSRLSAALVGNRGWVLAIAWAVMIVEAAFPFALMLPTNLLLAVLASALAFHLGIAVFMGLNAYPWAFLAAYPSAIALSRALRAALGWG